MISNYQENVESARVIKSLKSVFLEDQVLELEVPNPNGLKDLPNQPPKPKFIPLFPSNIKPETIIVEAHLQFSDNDQEPKRLEPKYAFYKIITNKTGNITAEKIVINKGPITELADQEFYGIESDPIKNLRNSPPVLRKIGVGDELDNNIGEIQTHFQLIKQVGKNSDFFMIGILTPKELDRISGTTFVQNQKKALVTIP